MVSLVVPGAAVVQLNWTYANGVVGGVNVLGAVCPVGVTVNQALANTIGAAIKSALTSSGLVAELHTSTSLVSVGIRDIRSANNPMFVDSGGAVAGTGTGDPLPRQTALCVTIKTAKSGASFRGRCYIGGFTELANGSGATAASSTVTACGNFLTSVAAALTTSGLTLGVLSRPGDKVVITTERTHSDGTVETDVEVRKARVGAITPMSAVVVRNSAWDSQRRRTSAGSTSTVFAQVLYDSSAEGAF